MTKKMNNPPCLKQIEDNYKRINKLREELDGLFLYLGIHYRFDLEKCVKLNKLHKKIEKERANQTSNENSHLKGIYPR